MSHSCNAEVSCACDKPTSTTTQVVDDAAYYLTSTPLWMKTNFGGKASEL